MFNFLRGRPSGLEPVTEAVLTMIADCARTFELAMAALGAGDDIAELAAEIHTTDARINATEEDARRRLVVHVAVHGGADVGAVLVDLLLVKKLERIGDQHKNILDLADEGVRLPPDEDITRLRREVAEMFDTTAALLVESEPDAVRRLGERSVALRAELEAGIRAMIHSGLPASEAVPRALLFRYLKRIVANLAGVTMTAAEGIDRSPSDSPGT